MKTSACTTRFICSTGLVHFSRVRRLRHRRASTSGRSHAGNFSGSSRRMERGKHFNSGQKYVAYRRREGKSLYQTIVSYVREELRDKAAFTTTVRIDLEKRLGIRMSQSMIMSVVDRYRREVYVRGYQSPHRMTPFEQGFAVTWLDPNLPREQALTEAKERTDRLLQGEQTTSPLFQRVHSIFDIVTDVGLKRDIASQIYILWNLGAADTSWSWLSRRRWNSTLPSNA